VCSSKISKYYFCLVLFTFALMSKPMAVTLPVVLLILDIWPLGRWAGDRAKILMEKIPFFVLSLLSGWITIEAQARSSAFMAMEKLSIGFRLINAFHSVIFYILKIIIPVDLAAYYPLPFEQRVNSPDYLAAVVLAALFSWACFYYRKERPYLAGAWCFYLATLAPVLGILQVGSQAAADRYAYLPSLGILMLFSAGLSKLLDRQRSAMLGVSSVLILFLGYLTIQQLHTWRDSVALWENVVKVSPRVSEVAYGNLANAYRDAHRSEEALKAYDEAIAIGPPHAYPHDGKGTVLLELGRTQEAIAEFKTAAALDARYASPHRNLWFAYERLGMHSEALAEAQEAVRVDPDFAEAYSNLGISYGSSGKYEEAISAFKRALLIDAGNAQYLVNLATTYQRSGKYDEAIDLYKRAILLDPNRPVYFLNLGNTYLLKGMFLEAAEILEQAARLQPGNPGIYQKLAEVYEKSGQPARAKECRMRIKSLRDTTGTDDLHSR